MHLDNLKFNMTFVQDHQEVVIRGNSDVMFSSCERVHLCYSMKSYILVFNMVS